MVLLVTWQSGRASQAGCQNYALLILDFLLLILDSLHVLHVCRFGEKLLPNESNVRCDVRCDVCVDVYLHPPPSRASLSSLILSDAPEGAEDVELEDTC